MVKLVSFPAPFQGITKHELRDTEQQPLGSVMADIKYKACMSAVESNCHDIPRTVGEYLVQRSMTNKVYREAYTTSKVQRSLREIQEWVIKRRIDHTHNSRYPKLAARMTMDIGREQGHQKHGVQDAP